MTIERQIQASIHQSETRHTIQRAATQIGIDAALASGQIASLWSMLEFHATRDPLRTAMKFEGRETSYAELHDAAADLALRLRAAGLGAADRVGYLGKNSDHYFVLLFAVARIGAVMVPLNWRLSPEELAFVIHDSTMRCLYADDEFFESASILAGEASITALKLEEMIASEAERAADSGELPAGDDIVFQVYTSGTTGRPKGAMLSSTNLLALRAPGYRAGLAWFPRPASNVCVVLPVAHIAGTAYALFGFYAGARIVIGREFDAGELLKLIEQEQINHLLLAPAAMQLVMKHTNAATTNFDSLQYITYGAAPIPEALLVEAIAMFGCGFVQMYGMSEASGGVVALQPADHVSGVPGRLRSAGRPMPGVEVAIVDEDWKHLPVGTTGEIIIRSKAVMQGYWGRPDATVEVLNSDNWLRSGDIGRIDEDGYVFVLDRAKDMIISGGENIYPAEVENAIFGHPDVEDVAVVSAPSEKWGEEIVAIVVIRPGSEPTLEDILTWLEGKLARFKMPKRLDRIESLPRNAGNKILRRVLREPYWAGREHRIN